MKGLLAALASCWLLAAAPDTFALLGRRIAAPEMQAVTDRTLAAYLGPAVHVTETHAGDCNASVRISSAFLQVRTALLALRRVSDCGAPKPILALRLTVDQAGASAVAAPMRAALGKPCFDGPGAGGAPSVFWASPERIAGIVQDTPPSTAFSVFWVNQDTSHRADAQPEQMVRHLLEADLPAGCVPPG